MFCLNFLQGLRHYHQISIYTENINKGMQKVNEIYIYNIDKRFLFVKFLSIDCEKKILAHVMIKLSFFNVLVTPGNTTIYCIFW